ncbi:hypothetical protein [Chelativorans xinjiangense]|uniref:hypothetical protein n=1 Tax=Chelativorans xinjiangense TaxID=2681485 RepID=UPI001359FE2C|nr:hypothetical protein [Chelativorans xinjiangense]
MTAGRKKIQKICLTFADDAPVVDDMFRLWIMGYKALFMQRYSRQKPIGEQGRMTVFLAPKKQRRQIKNPAPASASRAAGQPIGRQRKTRSKDRVVEDPGRGA